MAKQRNVKIEYSNPGAIRLIWHLIELVIAFKLLPTVLITLFLVFGLTLAQCDKRAGPIKVVKDEDRIFITLEK